MKYYMVYKGEDEVVEVDKERARELLEGWWDEGYLNDLFEKEKSFRLYTAYVEVWTNKDGLVPMAGYYGVVG